MATTTTVKGTELAEIATLRGEMNTGLTALGGKIDTLIAKYEAADSARAEDRALAEARHVDHETRLRAQEARKTVSPWQLWSVFGTVAALVIAAAGVIVNAIK